MNKRNLIHTCTLLCLCLIGATAAPLRAGEPAAAGFFDLVGAGLPAEATVELSMARGQLALLARAAGDSDTAELLGGLEAVHLRQYAPPGAGALAAAAALPDSLAAAGWTLTRHETEGSRDVSLFVRTAASGSVAGLTLLVIDAARLVAVANVVGAIPPAQLGQLGLPITP